MADTISFDTAEQAQAYSAEQGGRFYVLAPETLAQIEAAEAAGGFDGGMSGASGMGGFSAPGVVRDSSSAAEPPAAVPAAVDPAEYDGRFGSLVNGVVDFALGVRDFLEAVKEGATGPIILVPAPELQRLLHGSTDDA